MSPDERTGNLYKGYQAMSSSDSANSVRSCAKRKTPMSGIREVSLVLAEREGFFGGMLRGAIIGGAVGRCVGVLLWALRKAKGEDDSRKK
jgi:hypothetical protein